MVTEQAIRTAPFNFGGHVRYVGRRRCELPAGPTGHEVVLAPGMVGVVILSSGTSRPWHCRVQFKNGFQLEVTPENRAEFVPTDAEASLPA